MYITKLIRCPACNAHLESSGIVLCSNPPFHGVKCSSNKCDWYGYIHDGMLKDKEYNVIGG